MNCPEEYVDFDFVSVFPTKIQKMNRVIKSTLSPQPILPTEWLQFSRSFKKKRANQLIWYTDENIRPPIHPMIDKYLSFDFEPASKRNLYFPSWRRLIGVKGGYFSREGISSSAGELTRYRTQKFRDKSGTACVFISNPESWRMHLVESVSKFIETDKFGRAFGRPVAKKSEVANNYRFILCFENDLYPGYVTEKLLDAYLMGAVPIYNGILGYDSHINRRCFLNLADFKSVEDLGIYASNLSDSQYEAIYSEPFFEQIPDDNDLINFLRT